MRARRKTPRYAFDEVRAALKKYWGFEIQRGRASPDHALPGRERDGRWDTSYSKTGYVISGYMPGYGHRHKHYRSLASIVRGCDLAKVIEEDRAR